MIEFSLANAEAITPFWGGPDLGMERSAGTSLMRMVSAMRHHSCKTLSSSVTGRASTPGPKGNRSLPG